MAEFNRAKVGDFLGSVRKYMQVRGPMSQKDLAEVTGVGVSTMSRFLTQKTTEINAQLIAKIAAKLDIPMHEIIDFVEESFSDQFIRLVKFYKGEDELDAAAVGVSPFSDDIEEEVKGNSLENQLTKTLTVGGTAKRNVTAKIKVGGKQNSIPFTVDRRAPQGEKTIKEKIDALTPRQKAYMNDFLGLDMEGRDLIVDLGNNLFRYFKQKGVDV